MIQFFTNTFLLKKGILVGVGKRCFRGWSIFL